MQRTEKDKKTMNHELYNGSSLFILRLTDCPLEKRICLWTESFR